MGRPKGFECSSETKARISAALKGRPGNNQGPVNASGLMIKGGRAWVRLCTGWERRARVVWVQHHGSIPRGWLVHHRGAQFPLGSPENKLDDRVENLGAMTRSEHNRAHEFGAARDMVGRFCHAG